MPRRHVNDCNRQIVTTLTCIYFGGVPITFAYVRQLGSVCRQARSDGFRQPIMEEAARASKCLFASIADVINVIACPQRSRYIQLQVARALWGDEVIDGAVHSPERGSSGLEVVA
jgi:hypothetical protein